LSIAARLSPVYGSSRPRPPRARGGGGAATTLNLNGQASSGYGATRIAGRLMIGGSGAIDRDDGGLGTGVIFYPSP
jgi:hypothetical protein